MLITITVTKNILAAGWREGCIGVSVFRVNLHRHTHARVEWMRGGKLGGHCTAQVSNTVAWARLMMVEMAGNWTLPRGVLQK